ncbi:hypothetical protein HG535_0E02420 [Zygotorulaspora mrakii]|uniref:Cyclin-like domain-containing protein n=1 Tax=Zygotorulaspora mrakii TaxID=42260 RepID=A0A7H9B3C3_ZYGMR|nr:uncharacterized protein HG535_0E02420 [Zygotorulaspora mrakii]QLG73158.1 hypothetical protein HG535_0E02420 [Zygotorulaspora mrakii]
MIRNNAKYLRGTGDMAFMSHVRRNVALKKSQNPKLVIREQASHQFSVMEYSDNLLNHLIRLDENNKSNVFKPSLPSFNSQPQINHKMRYLIFDFLMCCHTRLGLCTSTLFLCFNLLDRYTSRYIVESSDYQLLALTALWISSKYWDSKNRAASLPVLQNLCCKQYSIRQFKEMELHLLKALNWSLSQIATPDSFIDILLFLKDNKNVQPAVLKTDNITELININDIKSGSVMLCQLASFDLQLSFNYTTSQIALGAITLITIALKLQKLNQWENFQSSIKDASLIRICSALLDLVLKFDSLPSSFKFKYIDNSDPTSEMLLGSLQNYFIQLQLEELYRSQVLISANYATGSPMTSDHPPYEKNNDTNESSMRAREEVRRNRGEQNFAFTPFNLASIKSNTPSPAISSSTSPFASPYMAHELSSAATNVNTPDSLPTPSSDKTLAYPLMTSTASNYFTSLPLNSPSLSVLQNKMKLDGRKRSFIYGNSSAVGSTGIARTNSMIKSKRCTAAITSGATSTFVKGHKKRASSIMDIDFFEEEVASKR